jgi:hypothetical protein
MYKPHDLKIDSQYLYLHIFPTQVPRLEIFPLYHQSDSILRILWTLICLIGRYPPGAHSRHTPTPHYGNHGNTIYTGIAISCIDQQ